MSFFRRRNQVQPHNFNDRNTKFPTQQLLVLALCRICEPIAFMSIFPYVYYMVESFKITSDDGQIAIYAGMVTSAFALAEFSASVFWGRLSDKVGRKPILLTGLGGTGISMLVFGFAPGLPMALIGRALGGLLNGNIGVLQTTVAEVVKVKEHQPRAYAIMPFVWCLGSIIGCALGGSLANPVENYPSIFSRGSIFEKFPYLLPNLVCAVIVLFGLAVGILFLEETHEKKQNRRDLGLEVGRWILNRFKTSPYERIHQDEKSAEALLQETTALLEPDQEPPGYESREQSPKLVPSKCKLIIDEESNAAKPDHSVTKMFNLQVVLNIFAYGILAYHTIAFEQLLPVLLSMKEDSKHAQQLPFKFVGGFGLPTRTIGLILALQGVYQMFAQVVLFPYVVERIGSLKTFRFVAILYPLMYFITPYLVLLSDRLRMTALFCILIWKVTFQALAYPSNTLLLTNSVSSLLVLGAVNGFAASAASLSRAIGPTLSGLVQSAGLNIGYLGIAWWSTGAVAITGAIECLWMEEPLSKFRTSTTLNEDVDGDLHGNLHLDDSSEDSATEVQGKYSDLSFQDEHTSVPKASVLAISKG